MPDARLCFSAAAYGLSHISLRMKEMLGDISPAIYHADSDDITSTPQCRQLCRC